MFPSMTEAFGLVPPEAIGERHTDRSLCGYGPNEVVDQAPFGVIDHDFRTGALAALTLDREVARTHALRFSWDRATSRFLQGLHPYRPLEQAAQSRYAIPASTLEIPHKGRCGEGPGRGPFALSLLALTWLLLARPSIAQLPSGARA